MLKFRKKQKILLAILLLAVLALLAYLFLGPPRLLDKVLGSTAGRAASRSRLFPTHLLRLEDGFLPERAADRRAPGVRRSLLAAIVARRRESGGKNLPQGRGLYRCTATS